MRSRVDNSELRYSTLNSPKLEQVEHRGQHSRVVCTSLNSFYLSVNLKGWDKALIRRLDGSDHGTPLKSNSTLSSPKLEQVEHRVQHSRVVCTSFYLFVKG